MSHSKELREEDKKTIDFLGIQEVRVTETIS